MSSKRQTYIRPNRIGKALLMGTVCGVLVGGGAIGGAAAMRALDNSDSGNSAYGNTMHIKPCIEEDSRNCVWNANTSGNGVGDTFIDYNGTAYYAEK